jgi:hypothetical protein
MRRLRFFVPGVVAVGCLAVAAPAYGGVESTSPVYNSLPASGTVQVPSVGAEAHAFNQFGNEVILSKPTTIGKISVTMVSFTCQTGGGANCATTENATFPTPITLTLYNASKSDPSTGEVTPGSVITTVTQTFQIKFRPSADPTNCTNPARFLASDGACHSGIDQNVVFQIGKKKLPVDVVWGVNYNTDNSGPNPIGGTGAPQDSLNVGFSSAVTTGISRYADSIFWDTRTLGNSCADPTSGNGGPFVTGEFNKDGACNGTANSWAGLNPAAKFTPAAS